jgi:predicted AAA+ superfamily ATPase
MFYVCYLLNEENEKREMKGLFDAMEYTKLDEGILIIVNDERKIKQKRNKINIQPAWKWLLSIE